ncbi:MAG: hypothetical protein WC319_16115 [Candidatus Paceibacterota bacterium]|jgi:hypothetical protein
MKHTNIYNAVKKLIDIGIELNDYEELNINIDPDDHTICASLFHKDKDIVIYIKDLEYPTRFEICKRSELDVGYLCR